MNQRATRYGRLLSGVVILGLAGTTVGKVRPAVPVADATPPLGHLSTDEREEGKRLRILIRTDIPSQHRSADIYGTLGASIQRFEEKHGVDVEVIGFPTSVYDEQLRVCVNGTDPPHVLWGEASALRPLADGGIVIPLGPAEGRYGTFVYEGSVYGLPLGDEGDLVLNGYMMTRQARREQLEEAALALIEHLRREVPPRGLPDVTIDRIETLPFSARGRAPWWRRSAWFRAEATLRNLGEAPAARVAVSFRLGNQRRVRRVRSLPVGDIRKVQCWMRVRRGGARQLEVHVDPNDRIREDNEVNNAVEEVLQFDPFPGPLPIPPVPSPVGTPFVLDAQAYRTNVQGMGPKAAFDGQNYMVVWARQTPLTHLDYNHELRAARVSPTGLILDPGGFSVAPGGQKYDHVEIEFDDVSTYLVVWERDALYFDQTAEPVSIIEGALLSSNGTIAAGPFVIEDDPAPAGPNRIGHQGPSVYFDGSAFRVVYTSMVQWTSDAIDITTSQSGIYSRRVDPLLGTVGPRVSLVSFTGSLIGWGVSASSHQADAFMAFTGVDGTNALTANHMIWGTWFEILGNAGLTSGTMPIVSSTDPYTFDAPTVGFHLTDVVTVWEDETQKLVPHQPDLHAAHGQAVPGPNGITSLLGPAVQGTNENFPRIDDNGQNFVVVFRHCHGCHSYIGSVGIDHDGTVGQYAYFDFGGPPDLVQEVDVSSGGSNDLIVFEHFNMPSTPGGTDGSLGIWGLLISS